MLSRWRFALTAIVVIALSNHLSAQQPVTGSQPNQLTMITVTVTDRHRNYVMGLTQDAFTVTDEKAVRPIGFFKSVDEPMSIGILVDTSGSMLQTDAREIARPKPIADAIWRFVELGNDENEYFLASFDVNFRLLTEWKNAKALLADKPAIIPEKKMTALYDACLAALEKLETGRYRKRALILFSDGGDTVSKRKYSELVRVLRKSDIIVYAIGPRQIFDIFGFRIRITKGEDVLAELSSLTGGVAFVPENRKGLELVIEQIAIELRHQYRLGFRASEASAPKKWRRLEVKVTPPSNAGNFSKLTIRSREGYQ